ncbi:hypothetical protein AAFF_G00187160 [Aldrovandia affinis]|uniref:Uncharacterized protein n=1 Tax=Aldrovandia affinis TaxID=143900 RepID=A0AAD7WWF5_9TELE|nr:hypothetical protein AAFF_G00187160 [Aldrovandia affinis]
MEIYIVTNLLITDRVLTAERTLVRQIQKTVSTTGVSVPASHTLLRGGAELRRGSRTPTIMRKKRSGPLPRSSAPTISSEK